MLTPHLQNMLLVNTVTVLTPCGLHLAYYILSIIKTGFLTRGSFGDILLIVFLW
jgi:hypothetical protein